MFAHLRVQGWQSFVVHIMTGGQLIMRLQPVFFVRLCYLSNLLLWGFAHAHSEISWTLLPRP